MRGSCHRSFDLCIYVLYIPLLGRGTLFLFPHDVYFYWFKNGGWDTVGSVWAVCLGYDRRTGASAPLSPLSAILRTLVSAGELCGTAVSLSRPCSP